MSFLPFPWHSHIHQSPSPGCHCDSSLIIFFFKCSTNEDDEVFFGPVGHKERCIAASLDLNRQAPEQPPAPGSGSPCTWSPLTGEKFVEVYKEAHLLALQIESHSRKEVAQAAKPQNPVNQGKETFVQDSQLKISLFEKEQKRDKSPVSLKRETFCLPSSTAQPLLREPQLPASPGSLSSPVPAGPVQTQNNQGLPCSTQPLPRESGTSQPPGQAGPQRRITSKLQPPRALPVRGRNLHLATDKVSLTQRPPPLPLFRPCPALRTGKPSSGTRIWTVKAVVMGSPALLGSTPYPPSLALDVPYGWDFILLSARA